MYRFTFYAEGAGIEVAVIAASRKEAHALAWDSLNDEQRNDTTYLDQVDTQLTALAEGAHFALPVGGYPSTQFPQSPEPEATAKTATLAHYQAQAAQAGVDTLEAPRHHTLLLPCPWGHNQATEVRSFAINRTDRHPEVAGRAALSLSGGSFDLRLTTAPAELRALAALLMNVAAEQDALNGAAA